MSKLGRKQAHKEGDARDTIWATIRQLKKFRASDIIEKTNIPQRTITTYLYSLVLAGFLSKETEEKEWERLGNILKYKVVSFTLIRDNGFDAPRLRRDGSPILETSQNRMWRAIRILKIFTLQELLSVVVNNEVSVSTTAADTYLKQLRKAGYLKKQRDDKAYQINPAMNYGAKAPQIQKINQIYDPNIKKVVWSDKEVA